MIRRNAVATGLVQCGGRCLIAFCVVPTVLDQCVMQSTTHAPDPPHGRSMALGIIAAQCFPANKSLFFHSLL